MSIYSSAADVYAYQHASDDSLMHQTRLSQLQAARERMLFLIARVELVTKSPTMTDAFKASSFEQIIRERCAKESLTGICDTILVVPCRGVGRQIHETVFHALCALKPTSSRAAIFKESVALVEDFQLILSPAPERPRKKQAIPKGTVLKFEPKKSKEPTQHLEKDNGRRDDKPKKDSGLQPPPSAPLKDWPKLEVPKEASIRMKMTLNPLFTDHSTEDGSPKPPYAPVFSTDSSENQQGASTPIPDSLEYFLTQYYQLPKARHFGIDFLLGLLFVEYKKAGDSTIHKATNQARTYAAAVLAFFELLGITKQPVYLFITDGNQGALSMAMYNESEQDKVGLLCCAFPSIKLTIRVYRGNHLLWNGTYVCTISQTLAMSTSFPFSCKDWRNVPKDYARSLCRSIYLLSSSG